MNKLKKSKIFYSPKKSKISGNSENEVFRVLRKSRILFQKKGFFIDTTIDIYGWIIFLLGLAVWTLVFYIAFAESDVYSINEKEIEMDNTAVFLRYLRSPTESKESTIIDVITLTYKGKETKETLKQEIDLLLEKAYPRPVCWNLWYYEGEEKKILTNEECKGRAVSLFDASTTTALPGGTNLKIRLTIPGYK